MAISDIVQFANASFDEVKKLIIGNPMSKVPTFRQMANKDTLVFPLIFTDGIDYDVASLLMKGLEREYVSYIQIIMSAHQAIDVKDSIKKHIGLTYQNESMLLDLNKGSVNTIHYIKNWSYILEYMNVSHDINLAILNEATRRNGNNNNRNANNRNNNNRNANNRNNNNNNRNNNNRNANNRNNNNRNENNNNNNRNANNRNENNNNNNRNANNRNENNNNDENNKNSTNKNNVSVKLIDDVKKNYNNVSRDIKGMLHNREILQNELNSIPQDSARYNAIRKDIVDINRKLDIQLATKEELGKELASTIRGQYYANKKDLLKKYARPEDIIGDMDGKNWEKAISDITSDNIGDTPKVLGVVQNGGRLLDQVVKKYNSLQPTLVEFEVVVTTSDGKSLNMRKMLAIKTKSHFIKQSEMLDQIANAVKNKSVLLNFIKWSSGEISLFKDILLGINNGIKTIARDRNSRIPKLWKKIFDGHSDNIIRKTFKRPVTLPVSSLILSTDDVFVLNEKYGIDIRNSRYTNMLFSKLLITNFLIVDQANETVDMYDVDDKTFDTYMFSDIKNENDSSQNKIIKSLIDYTNSRR